MKVFTLIVAMILVGCQKQPDKKHSEETQNPSGSNQSVVPAQSSSTPISYIPVWECIPPPYRPAGVDLKDTPPSSQRLTEGLLFMAGMGEKECVQRLVDAGADINSAVRSSEPSFADGPALHSALNQRHWDVALYLLSKGADPNRLTTYTDSPKGGFYSALDMAESSAPENVLQALKDKNAKHLRYTQQ